KPEEKISGIIAVRDFVEGSFLLTATRKGLVKKTKLTEYSRPRAGGIIGMGLDDDDNLIGVCLTRPGDEIVLSTNNGMAIRFSEADARAMGRAAFGVKGIKLVGDDEVVGMVVADPDGYLLTVCELGLGKRTPFGPNEQDSGVGIQDSAEEAPEESADASEISREAESAEPSAE